jgi:hypothetical protein
MGGGVTAPFEERSFAEKRVNSLNLLKIFSAVIFFLAAL